ncbi:MAG: signal recognition particle-docking protein FtsY [Bacteroidota bacterium]
MGLFDFFSKKEHKEDLNKGLEKTKESFFNKLTKAVAGKTTVDDILLDQVEEALMSADVGLETTVKIIERIEKRVAIDKYVGEGQFMRMLKEEIQELLLENKTEDLHSFDISKGISPYVIMVVGINGVGKTTTIGKLAYQLKLAGKNILLGAADTFRAAAIEQLDVWAKRVDVPIIKKQMGSDPASVAFDTLESAKAKGYDTVIIDTAGRLHNKLGLMNELTKVKTVMKKVFPDAPHEVLLVLDASTGQNAIIQAREFMKATEVTAIALTKLDGTAKGGVVLGISDQFKIPIKFIGVGEAIDKLQVFNRKEFVDSLFAD